MGSLRLQVTLARGKADVQEIETLFVEEDDPAGNPLGVKGMGADKLL